MYLIKKSLENHLRRIFFQFIENLFPTDRIIWSIELSEARLIFRELKNENPVKEILYLGIGWGWSFLCSNESEARAPQRCEVG